MTKETERERKTLKEIIQAADCCKDVTDCSQCPYYKDKGKLMACMDKGHGKNLFLEDVAYYLKKYQRSIGGKEFVL